MSPHYRDSHPHIVCQTMLAIPFVPMSSSATAIQTRSLLIGVLARPNSSASPLDLFCAL